MKKALIHIPLLCFLFVYGSFHVKNFLDAGPELEFKKDYFAGLPSKVLTRVLLFNRRIAISQFYQFQMIAYLTRFDLPADYCPHCAGETDAHAGHDDEHGHGEEGHDPVAETIKRIKKKYMLTHIGEFFDIDRYYKLMKLSLEFDPRNFFVKEFGMHLSMNAEMMRRCLEVFESVYRKHPGWKLAFDTGWLYFYCMKDYPRAREWYREAMRHPESPPMVRSAFQATYALEGRYDLAIRTTKAQLEKARNPVLRKSLRTRLAWFEALNLLSSRAALFRERTGRQPEDLDELVRAGLLDGIPDDPVGDGFYWDGVKNEPASRNNPYELVEQRNPIAVEKIDVDDPERDAETVGHF